MAAPGEVKVHSLLFASRLAPRWILLTLTTVVIINVTHLIYSLQITPYNACA